MPGNSFHPAIALLAGFDAAEWAGVNVFDRAASHVSLPALSAMPTRGVYSDAITFLNGRASNASLGLIANINSAKTGASTWTMGIGIGDAIGNLDRVWIESSTDDFTLTAGTGLEAWGFDAGGHGLVGGSAPYRRVASSEWTRGPVADNAYINIDPAGSAAFSIPATGGTTKLGRFQDVITSMRYRGVGDADDLANGTCLEDVDTAGPIRWGLNASGHVYCSRPTATTDEITWVSTTFRNRLGFDGAEAETTAGGYSFLVATFMCPGVLCTGDTIAQQDIGCDEESSSRRLTDGDVSGNLVATWRTWSIAFWLTGPGPSQLVASSAPPLADLSRHWFQRFLPYVGRGNLCTLYQQWGDPRRSLPYHSVTTFLYSTLYTTERDGYRGRIVCRRDPQDRQAQTIQWEMNLRNRFQVSMLLTEVP